ncbi:hypothetical protein QUG92_16480 [Curtobacterium sp. RHCKG23]|uniref:Uncharacterized protein n=1 Tax=Curtobacterium citri TaxID=3055139 RepID=A0ABT7TAV8_9MICO|nr:hypothetical protein [Curtobacterium citri]MDM7886707.1 hypothetical protein [Curtobacterium citri]
MSPSLSRPARAGVGAVVAVIAVALTGCSVEVHTPTSDATEIAEANGSRLLRALSSTALGAPDGPELQAAVREQRFGGYGDVESLTPAELARQRGNLRAAVYGTARSSTGVEVSAYASGTAQGGGLSSSATVYGCFRAQLTAGSSAVSSRAVPCPDFGTSGSDTERTLVLDLPAPPGPDPRATPGG